MSGWEEEAREAAREKIHDHWCDETPCTVTDADYEGSDEQALADAILDALAPVVAAEVARAEARGKVTALREAAEWFREADKALREPGGVPAPWLAAARRLDDMAAIEAEAGESRG